MATLAKPELSIVEKPSGLDHLMQVALENQAGMEIIERLSDLRRRELEDAAEAEFNDAMHRVQEKMRRIGVDATNPQTHSRYATYAKLDAVLRPIYTAERFSLSFNTEPLGVPDMQRIICYVSHRAPHLPKAHTRVYRIDMPADGKGAKGNDVMTKTHATGAACQYGRRYLLGMIFNVATAEKDDDGNLAPNNIKPMDEGNVLDWISKIEESTTVDELKTNFFAAMNVAKEAGDPSARKAFEQAKIRIWNQKGFHA